MPAGMDPIQPNTRYAIILGVVLIGLRIYLTVKRSKDVRSPRVRRMERNMAIALWSFIALGILVLFLTHRFG